jgi:hypothetical protein
MKGYYSKADEPMFIYKCDSTDDTPTACAGGLPEACVGRREHFLCTRCPNDFITNDVDEDLPADNLDNGCQECTVVRETYLIIIVVAGLFLLSFELKEAQRSPLDEGPLEIEIKNVCGQLMMFLQILDAIQTAEIEFGDPFKSVLVRVTEPFEFAYVFSAVPCMSSGFKDPVSIFAIQIFLPVLFCIVITLVYLSVNCIKANFFPRDGLLNVFGEVLIEFYVAITIAMLTPFNCYDHPVDKTSMKAAPELLCFEGDHNTLIGLSVLGTCLFSISMLVITIVATWHYPRAMQKNDIGHLIRCHFLFNRWKPTMYWFVNVSVLRNFLVALVPMVLGHQGLVLSLMMIILILPLGWTANAMPRRTPAMNALDMHISFSQVIIVAIGSMASLPGSEGGETDFLSWCLMLICFSVGLVCCIIVLLKFGQFVSKGKTPGSWAFDVFFDHHMGAGANTARVLMHMYKYMFRKGKVFYDVDKYLVYRDSSIGVIMDAAKLSTHGVIGLSNETWCRDWCNAAIASLVKMHIPLSVLSIGTIEGNDSVGLQAVSSMTSGASKEMLPADVLEVLAAQAPRHKLRCFGLADELFPACLKAVLSTKAIHVSLASKSVIAQGLENMLQEMVAVPMPDNRNKDALALSPLLDKFFDFGEVDKRCVLISCDHADPEAVAVSRLFYSMFTDMLKSIGGNGAGVKPRASIADAQISLDVNDIGGFMQDVDMDAAAFSAKVRSGATSATVVIITQNSMQSISQLVRLGYIQQFAKECRPQPIAVTDAYAFPGMKVLDEIGKGHGVQYIGKRQESVLQYVTEAVSWQMCKLAWLQVLEKRVYLCDVKSMTEQVLVTRLSSCVLGVVVQLRAPAAACPTLPESSIQPDDAIEPMSVEEMLV